MAGDNVEQVVHVEAAEHVVQLQLPGPSPVVPEHLIDAVGEPSKLGNEWDGQKVNFRLRLCRTKYLLHR
jgi:hypothetical protein